MPSRTELADAAWNAMVALPKPVTADDALAAALGVLTGPEGKQFSDWFAKHSAYVLRRLNG